MAAKLIMKDVEDFLKNMYPKEEIIWTGGCMATVCHDFSRTCEGQYKAELPDADISVDFSHPEYRFNFWRSSEKENNINGFVSIDRILVLGKKRVDEYPVADDAKRFIEISGIGAYDSLFKKDGRYHRLYSEIKPSEFGLMSFCHAVKAIELAEKEIMGAGYEAQTEYDRNRLDRCQDDAFHEGIGEEIS